MFPFHRKHGSHNNTTSKQSGRSRTVLKDDLLQEDITDEEYLYYIHSNDRIRNQATSTSHDRYCNKVLREKEDILLSSLREQRRERRHQSIEDKIYHHNQSLPSSPTNYLKVEEEISRRKSDTLIERVGLRDSYFNLPTFNITNFETDSDSEEEARDRLQSASSLRPLPPPPAFPPERLIPCSRKESVSSLRWEKSEINSDKEYTITLKIDDSAPEPDITMYRIMPKDIPDLAFEGEAVGFDYNNRPKRRVDLATSVALKKLILGSPTKCFSLDWIKQNFVFSSIPNGRWRLLQLTAGCCGIIAAVEAHVIKTLLFDPGYSKLKEPLRPTKEDMFESLIHALCYILWQAGDEKRAVLITPGPRTSNRPTNEYAYDGITDSFTYVEYDKFEDLKYDLVEHIRYFTNAPNNGYINFIICAVLSRGIMNVYSDMDDEKTSLITDKMGHCSLELVLLLLSGRAMSNVFDNNVQLGECLLKGLTKQSDIGFLSLYEHVDTCQVGKFLKNPKYPIWVASDVNHFSILFSSKMETNNDDIDRPFILHHYDSLSAHRSEIDISLIIDPLGKYMKDKEDEDNLSYLQQCIKTKWKNCVVIHAENSELFFI